MNIIKNIVPSIPNTCTENSHNPWNPRIPEQPIPTSSKGEMTVVDVVPRGYRETGSKRSSTPGAWIMNWISNWTVRRSSERELYRVISFRIQEHWTRNGRWQKTSFQPFARLKAVCCSSQLNTLFSSLSFSYFLHSPFPPEGVDIFPLINIQCGGELTRVDLERLGSFSKDLEECEDGNPWEDGSLRNSKDLEGYKFCHGGWEDDGFLWGVMESFLKIKGWEKLKILYSRWRTVK